MNKMVDDSRFSQRSMRKKFKLSISLIYDTTVFILSIIPFYIQWIFKQFSKKKKDIRGQTALVSSNFSHSVITPLFICFKVTGAGNGLGKSISLKLASYGCHVVIADVDIDGAHKTALEIMQMGVKSKAYKVDVTNAVEIENLRDEITKEFGGVDIIINNAGIIAYKNLEVDAKHIELLVKVNLLGPLLVNLTYPVKTPLIIKNNFIDNKILPRSDETKKKWSHCLHIFNGRHASITIYHRLLSH